MTRNADTKNEVTQILTPISSKHSSSIFRTVIVSMFVQGVNFEQIEKLAVDAHPTLELVEVHVARISKRWASTAIHELNCIAPLPELRHLKRLRSIRSDSDSKLELLLCFAPSEEFRVVPKAVQEFLEKHDLEVVVRQVPRVAPTTRELWNDWKVHWPITWRPNGETSSSPIPTDFQTRAESHMSRVLTLMDSNSTSNACIAINPSTNL